MIIIFRKRSIPKIISLYIHRVGLTDFLLSHGNGRVKYRNIWLDISWTCPDETNLEVMSESDIQTSQDESSQVKSSTNNLCTCTDKT